MKMRRSIAVLAVAGAAACAGRAVPTPEALAGLPQQDDYPVEAWLSYQRVSDLAFTVNQPAYVAIFYIAPGRGVSMVYPSYRDELDRTDAGYNVPGYRYDPGQWYFTSAASFSPIATSPSYLLLVASREPLRVAEYERFPGLLRRTLGIHTFASYDAWDVIDELTQLVVPPQPDDAWSTDLIVLWPPMRANTYLASSTLADDRLFVRCDNGRIIMVPWDYPYAGCPFFSRYTDPQPTTPLPQPQTPGDSTATPPSGEEPAEPKPVKPGAGPDEPKQGHPRRVREDVQPGEAGPVVHIEREAPWVAARRTRDAYPDAWERGAARGFGRATTHAEPREVRGRAGDIRVLPSSRPSGGRDVHTASPRSTRSSPRTERATPAPRERSSSSDRSTSDRSSSGGSSSGARPASSDRPSSDRPSSDRPAHDGQPR